jgi:ABC-type branched-subunit amino acid transport system ATPase component
MVGKAMYSFFSGCLEDKGSVLGKHLPYGHRSALGMALAVAADPELLLLDEPITGMNEEEIQVITELVIRIRDLGVTIVVVEHNMRVIMDLCEHVMVLNFGEKIAEGPPAQVVSSRDVIEAYLGVEESS